MIDVLLGEGSEFHRSSRTKANVIFVESYPTYTVKSKNRLLLTS